MAKKEVPSFVKDERLIAKRRKEIVKAAVILFKEKGYHRTTTREIARCSGFSIGTLYEYIRTKEDILFLVCNEIYEQVKIRLVREINLENGGILNLENAIAAYFKLMDDMQDEVLVMYQESKSLTGEALSYVLSKELEMTNMFVKLIRGSVEAKEIVFEAKEIEMLAHTILVQGQMWTFRRWELHKKYTLEEYTRMQIDLLLHGFVHPKQVLR